MLIEINVSALPVRQFRLLFLCRYFSQLLQIGG